MDVSWNYVLKEGDRTNPVIYCEYDIAVEGFKFNEDQFNEVMDKKGHQLKTWGKAESTSEPHWIGVRKQTPLHTDRGYPRYTWHLIVKSDNFSLRGLDKEEVLIRDNTLVQLDTHSPHQLLSKDKFATYYLACSVDSKILLPKEEVLPKILNYIKKQSIGENGKRIRK
ncbi:MAG: hypothetical protein EXR81_06980 [Gammaproteobacteria bacterium]|nr:hypothetical protein [Gammaproteobacteria bacterium]